MAARSARKAAKRNVGASRSKVGRGKESRSSGQVSLEEAQLSARRAITHYGSNLHFGREGAEQWLMEQIANAYFSNPQAFRCYTGPDYSEIEFYWSDQIFTSLGVDPATLSVSFGKPATRASRKVHAGNGSKRKQRA